MKVVKTVKEVREIVSGWRQEGLTVGLVPTMGFLHEGHQSLIRKSASQNDRPQKAAKAPDTLPAYGAAGKIDTIITQLILTLSGEDRQLRPPQRPGRRAGQRGAGALFSADRKSVV